MDTSDSAQVETGYFIDRSSGYQYYFSANTPWPLNQQYVNVCAIQSGDHYNYTGFKMTRNRQSATSILVQMWGVSAGSGCTQVYQNNMGGSTWAGNDIQIGSELIGTNNGGPIFQSSNGTIAWINNKYQTNDGIYHYQYGTGYDPNLNSGGPFSDFPPESASWSVLPAPGGTGGIFNVSCGC